MRNRSFAAPLLLVIIGGAEPLGQIELFQFFSLTGFEALLDQFHQNTVIAETPLLGYCPYFSGNVGGQRHASTHVSSMSFGHYHCIIIHHTGAQLLEVTRQHKANRMSR